MTSDFEKKIVKPSRKSLYFDETPIVIYQSHKHNKRKKNENKHLDPQRTRKIFHHKYVALKYKVK